VDEAIAAGIRFLRGNLGRDATGLWRDFALPGVSSGSTECVSAFIAAQIAGIPEAAALATTAVENLVSRARQTGGWGYREDVPEDCDSTAWVLLAAAATGVDVPPPVIERATRFIAEHQHDNGGFVTYGPDAKEFLTPTAQPGWFEPEVSVTSSAVLALNTTGRADPECLRSAGRFISRNCQDGLWKSYWWNGFGYPTYLSISALSAVAPERCHARLAVTRDAVLARRGRTGGWANEPGMPDNGFSTSFALRTLYRTGEILDDDTVSYLSGLGTADGGSLPSTEMLAPGGANGSDLVLRDSGNVTTACVIRALHDARQLTGARQSTSPRW
jgi:hypothetical protein